jgi:hypothetical protein
MMFAPFGSSSGRRGGQDFGTLPPVRFGDSVQSFLHFRAVVLRFGRGHRRIAANSDLMVAGA